MNESEFCKELKETLIRGLSKDYIVGTKRNLIYKIIIDEEGQFRPSNPKSPRRGNLAFQTDLSVEKDNLPLVVSEVKYGAFSTHDVLVYSAKALKHKEVYPYLRYGLIVGGVRTITNKFFTHNAGFDFALALENTSPKNMKELIMVVKGQISNAKSLLDVLRDRNRVRLFNDSLEIEMAR